MIPTFFIFFREGVEASMIVAILLSYLNRLGQRRHFRDVFLGVTLALATALVGGWAIFVLVAHYQGSNVQTYIETATYLLAVVALTYMTFWMQRHARTLGVELERRSDVALSGRTRTGVSFLAFQAVAREGLETMVFTLAIVFSATNQSAPPLRGYQLFLGAGAGLLVALAVAVAVYRLGVRLNLRRFFQVLGVVLMVFAAGLLADSVENFQQLAWLPGGREVVWNTRSLLAQNSSLGDILHSLFGYADRPTVLQVLVWGVYVVLSTVVFLRHGHRRASTAPPKSTPSVNDSPRSSSFPPGS